MKVCIVAGGSGGHIYPALTFSDYLKEKGSYDIFYIGNDHKMEARIIPEAGYPFYSISNQGLQGSHWDKVKAVFGQFKAILDSRKHLKKLKPDLVFAFGGYVTLPVVIAAKSLGIKIALHEQNAFVGKANKWVSGLVDVIFTCYEEAFKGNDKVYMFGNPRAALGQDKRKDPVEMDRIGLDKDKRMVLIVMGSQGSDTMNKLIQEAFIPLKDIDYQIVFVTGPLEYEEFVDDIKGKTVPKNIFIESYVNQAKLMPYTNLIVARAGASTITEIAAFRTPSILIPSPYVANNHQYFNAQALYKKQATVLLEEKDLNLDSFIQTIEKTLNNQALLEDMKENVAVFDTPLVNDNILDVILKVVNHE